MNVSKNDAHPYLGGQSLTRLPSISTIRAFEAVVRLGSMEKASTELALTASAVGKRIASLEEMLGVQLLTRRARGVTPTVAGIEYMEQVRTALGLLSSIALHQRKTKRTRRLQVCVPPTFARQILVPNMAGFLQNNPDIEPEVVLSIPYLGLHPQEADVEVIASPSDRAAGKELLPELLRPMCSPAYLRENRLSQDIESFRNASLIRCPLEPWRPWFEAAGLEWSEPTVGPLLVDSGLTLEAAASGLGVALARPSLARRWLQTGQLIVVSEIGSRPSTIYSLVQHPKAEASDAAESFASWLIDICAGMAD